MSNNDSTTNMLASLSPEMSKGKKLSRQKSSDSQVEQHSAEVQVDLSMPDVLLNCITKKDNFNLTPL